MSTFVKKKKNSKEKPPFSDLEWSKEEGGSSFLGKHTHPSQSVEVLHPGQTPFHMPMTVKTDIHIVYTH